MKTNEGKLDGKCNRSEVKYFTKGVTCVMESIILHVQKCLHDADKNNVKVKSYSYGELNCGGLHILTTFI